MASLILGIMGKKRAGKDTFAARLVDSHGFTRLAFADALKAVLADMDPVVDVETFTGGGAVRLHLSDVLGPDNDWEVAKEIPEVRRLLQVLGVAAREHVLPSLWVDAVMRKAAAIDGPVVITDVRFPNEADVIQLAGGKLIRVHRPAVGVAGGDAVDSHVSETALDDRAPDYYVRNDGDIARLHRFADGIARPALAEAAVIAHALRRPS